MGFSTTSGAIEINVLMNSSLYCLLNAYGRPHVSPTAEGGDAC